jgi:hypothetical protein
MATSLEELQRQRAQIQSHLDWLDAKIAECNASNAKHHRAESEWTLPIEKNERTSHQAPPPKTPSSNPSVEATVKKEASPPAEEIVPEALSSLPELPGIKKSTYVAKTQSELRRAKIGCFALFVFGCLLFLFLLFGLPYLL